MFVNPCNSYFLYLGHYKAKGTQFTRILYSVSSQQRLSLFLALGERNKRCENLIKIFDIMYL